MGAAKGGKGKPAHPGSFIFLLARGKKREGEEGMVFAPYSNAVSRPRWIKGCLPKGGVGTDLWVSAVSGRKKRRASIVFYCVAGVRHRQDSEGTASKRQEGPGRRPGLADPLIFI